MLVLYSFIPILDKVQIYKKRKDNEKLLLKSELRLENAII